MTTEKPIRCRIAPILALSLLLTLSAAVAASASPAPPQAGGPRVVSRTLATAARSWSYGWPLRPFDRQHPVRSFLDDPRIAARSAAFHFGIDISAPDGTPVYSVEAGTVSVHSPEALAVVTPGRSCVFGYWHIVLAVKSHQFVERHQLLGWVGKGWGHVHFAERRNGVYLNPLRPGGIGPYVDRTIPAVRRVVFDRGALVAYAFDTQSPRVPGAWRDEPLSPALLRWRVAGERRWQTAVDFRSTMLPASRFGEVYAPATRQNHKGVPGRYCFYLARGGQALQFAHRTCVLEVEASDTAGNRVVVSVLLGA